MTTALSVIVPVRNGAAFLAEAIESIRAQRHEPLEIIVVDDGSTDDTPAVAAGFNQAIRYVRQEHAGPSSARNRGLALADGEMIAFLDADDLWPAEKLARQLESFERNPELDAVVGYIQKMRRSPSAGDARAFQNVGAPYFFYQLGAALFRKSILDRLGGFDPALRFGEDATIFLRALEMGARIAITDDVTLHYRIHDQNMTVVESPSVTSYVTLIKRSLDRRRKSGAGVPAPLARVVFPAPKKSAGRPRPSLVSVIVPVHNGEAFLKNALESVRSQEGVPLEILVVDDGSTDGSAAIANGFGGVRYFHQKNQGVAAARNRGVAEAKGEAIAFLDQDDWWPAGALARQVAALGDHPRAIGVLGRTDQVIEPGASAAVPTAEMRRSGDTSLILGAFLAWRDVFARVGPFDARYRFASDLDWFVRAKEAGLFFAQPSHPALVRRIHGENESYWVLEKQQEYMRVLQESIRRKKSASATSSPDVPASNEARG